jgi:hypothetical protein
LHPAKPELPDARQEGNQDGKCHAQSQPYVLLAFQSKLLLSALTHWVKVKKNRSKPLGEPAQ